jgi:hypothetical protein
MVEPEAVAAMLRLMGWTWKRIARELGISRGRFKRYLRAGGWHRSGNQ